MRVSSRAFESFIPLASHFGAPASFPSVGSHRPGYRDVRHPL